MGIYGTLKSINKGKVILLDFWATWCGPCLASYPSLKAIYKKYEKNANFQLVGISLDSDSTELMKYIAQTNVSWVQLWDKNYLIKPKFPSEGIPYAVLIDKNGLVQHTEIGTITVETEKYLITKIDSLLNLSN
jgi:thiol-disulfide isomerase/thioredoxin